MGIINKLLGKEEQDEAVKKNKPSIDPPSDPDAFGNARDSFNRNYETDYKRATGGNANGFSLPKKDDPVALAAYSGFTSAFDQYKETIAEGTSDQVPESLADYLNERGTQSGAIYLAAMEKLDEYVEQISAACSSGTEFPENIQKISTELSFNPCEDADKYPELFAQLMKELGEEAFSEALGEKLPEIMASYRLGAETSTEDEIAEAESNLAELEQRRLTERAFRYAELNFKEQCFLLSHILTLADIKKGFDAAGVNHQFPNLDNSAAGNSSLMVHGDPFGFINRLTQSSNKEHLFELSTDKLSSLQPMIRLYKIIVDTETKKEKEVEITFDPHISELQGDLEKLILKPGNAHRGVGVGIKDFVMSYEANNPFAIKKSIKAKLTLFATNFGELYRDRNGVDSNGVSTTYKYLDLALKTGDEETFSYVREKINPKEYDSVLSNTEKLNFRLKAVVGWANPKGNKLDTAGGFRNIFDSDSLKAIYDSYVTINLTPTIHNFDFDELGRVTFTLNYLAYIEDFFDQPGYNILMSTDSVISQIKRKLKYIDLSKKCKPSEVSQIKNSSAEAQAIENEKINNFRSLMENMANAGKIRVFDMPIDKINQYREYGPLQQLDEDLKDKFINDEVNRLYSYGDLDIQDLLNSKGVKEGSEEQGGDKNTIANEPEVQVNYNGIANVSFFWVSDLIDVILSNIGNVLETLPAEISKDTELNTSDPDVAEEILNYRRYLENFYKLRVVLGPLELVNPNEPAEEGGTSSGITVSLCNMGDVPISVKYFLEWMTNAVLKVNRQKYPLNSFLNEFFNNFIRDFLNRDTCYGSRAKQKTRVFQTAITAYNENPGGNPNVDDITYYSIKQQNNGISTAKRLALLPEAAEGSSPPMDAYGTPWPVLNVMGGREQATYKGALSNEMNYLVYFVGRSYPMDKLTGIKSNDHRRGIFHYQIGKNTGIVKNISLKKTNSPGLAEVRFEQNGYDGLQQLLVLYDADISTFLDINSFPGTYIYIEPRGFDPSLNPLQFTELGVGGYYMIVRTEHTIGPGKANTDITAKWVAQIDADTAVENGEVAGRAPSQSICPTVQDKRQPQARSAGEGSFASKIYETIFGVPPSPTNPASTIGSDGSTGSEKEALPAE